MTNLKLTAGDTKPLACNYTSQLSGCSISLVIGYPEPLTKAAVITNAAKGSFRFEWDAGDLRQGVFQANLIITDAAGKFETSDQFTFDIGGRV
jgi:hypothetical protein